jgi:LL-diaminopimelate aminotransferase
MLKVNENFLKLPKTYLFSKIAEKVSILKSKTPDADLLNLGIGDICYPLAQKVANSFIETANELSAKVHGYGPAEGHLFLREKILSTKFETIDLHPDEIFISDGIVRDICDVQDLFAEDSTIGIIDPTYPAYFQTSIIAGKKIFQIPCHKENGFIPKPPKERYDLIYLCTPNNPTGTAMTRSDLKLFVDYAREHNSLLLVDAAYAAFITSSDIPKTIYEIEGAKDYAIEFHSFSKSAGFTSLRLGYTIIPKNIQISLKEETISLNTLWRQRQDIKTNGISLPIQKAGYQTLFGKGKEETESQVATYKKHALGLKNHLKKIGFEVYGGEDAPYVWWRIPNSNSWEFFEHLLNKHHLITIPGEGFGLRGEGYIRLSGFITNLTFEKSLERFNHVGDELCAMK